MKIFSIFNRIQRKIRFGLNRLFILVGYTGSFFVLVFFMRHHLSSNSARVLVLEQQPLQFAHGSSVWLWKKALHKALEDKHLQRIVVNLNIHLSLAEMQSLKVLLLKLKAQGKEIICYADAVGTLGGVPLTEYCLGSCATRFYLGNSGHMFLEGINTERLYFEKCLTDLGVRGNFVAQGKYKSGPDSFTRSTMSLEERGMIKRLLTCWNKQILETLAEDKRITLPALKDGLSHLTCSSKDAVKLRWVDATASCWNEIERRYALRSERTDASNYVQKHKTFWNWFQTYFMHRHHIALVRIEGELGSLDLDTGAYCEQLITLSQDASIKGVVVILNTPGGTSVAAETLRYGVECCRKAGKSTAIVMEAVAASGGYWIACAGERIWAQPGTLTGSIGVYAGKFDVEEALKRFGVGISSVGLGVGASESLYKSWSIDQKARWEKITAFGYNHFIALVAAARGLTIEQTDAIAQGQVWTGQEAKILGLVDAVGDFWDAVSWMKQKNLKWKTLPIIDYTPDFRYSLQWILSILKEQVMNLARQVCMKGSRIYALMVP